MDGRGDEIRKNLLSPSLVSEPNLVDYRPTSNGVSVQVCTVRCRDTDGPFYGYRYIIIIIIIFVWCQSVTSNVDNHGLPNCSVLCVFQ